MDSANALGFRTTRSAQTWRAALRDHRASLKLSVRAVIQLNNCERLMWFRSCRKLVGQKKSIGGVFRPAVPAIYA